MSVTLHEVLRRKLGVHSQLLLQNLQLKAGVSGLTLGELVLHRVKVVQVAIATLAVDQVGGCIDRSYGNLVRRQNVRMIAGLVRGRNLDVKLPVGHYALVV
uniref:(northern house mosquito) hypothetical protein n=1 Tax=Culex pipiens TaxID=7175 RepID=A0A8D8EXN4_CULPI